MVKKTTIILGIVVLILGILGLFKNSIIGNGAFFEANTAHSILHIIIGIVLAVVAMKCEKSTVLTLKIVGVVVVVVAVLGFLSASGKETGLIFQLFTVNSAVNWLHLVVGVVLAVMGWSKCGAGTCSHEMCKPKVEVTNTNATPQV